MASGIDFVRSQVPWMKDLSDEEVLTQTARITGKSLSDAASYIGYEAPSSMMGKELYAGGNRYLGGFGHIGSAMGIPGAAEYTKRKEERADTLQALSPAPHSWDEVKVGDSQKGVLPYLGQLAAGSAPVAAEAAGLTVADVLSGGMLTPAVGPRIAANVGRVLPEFLGGQGLRAGADYAARRTAIEGAREAAPGLARTAMLPVYTYPSSLGDTLGSQHEESGRYNLPSAMAAAVPYSALNVLGLEGAITRGALPRLGLQGLEKNVAGRVASGALATSGSEAVGETGQELANQAARMGVNPDAEMFSPEAIARYKESAIGGGALGLIPGMAGGIRGHRQPLDRSRPADLTKRIPNSASMPMDLPLDHYGPQSPKFDQGEYEQGVDRQWNGPPAPPGPATPGTVTPFTQEEYEAGLTPTQPGMTEPFDIRAQLEGLGPRPPPGAPPAGGPKGKATANATRDSTAAPLSPEIQAITDVKNALVTAHNENFPGEKETKKPHVIRQEITRWVGDPKTMEEAVATLQAKIVSTLMQGGKGQAKRDLTAERMIMLHNKLLGLPPNEQQTAQAWRERIEQEQQAAALGPVPTKPTNPAELPAYREAIKPHLLAGVAAEELEALQLVEGVNFENAGDEEAVETTLREMARGAGIPHTTLADRAARAITQITANAEKVGLPAEAARALLGMHTSLDVLDTATPTTAYEGTERVNVAPSDDFQEEAGYEPDLKTYGVSEKGAVETTEATGLDEGEADTAVEQEHHEEEAKPKWNDELRNNLAEAKEEYESYAYGYAAGDPKWDALTEAEQLQWVKGYVGAYTMYPQGKQVEERRKLTDVVRTSMADEQERRANESDDGKAKEGADAAGAAEGVGREVGGVQGTVQEQPPSGVPSAAAGKPEAAGGQEPEKPATTGQAPKAVAKPATPTQPVGDNIAPAAAPTPPKPKKESAAVRGERKWGEAQADRPELGAWGDLSTKAQQRWIEAAEKDQTTSGAGYVKRADKELKAGPVKVFKLEQEEPTEQKPVLTSAESAQKKWDEEHLPVAEQYAIPLGKWDELSKRAQDKFIKAGPNHQSLNDAVTIKASDDEDAAGHGGNMKQDIRATPGVDMTRMAKLLGPQLYGNLSDIGPITIKELFQNSFDALKGAIGLGQRKDGEISVDLNETERTITLTDNGTGMTPETINKAFLTLAGTMKETDRASGGLGIAKMLFLFGNESLTLRTVRDGVESTLVTSGKQLMAAFSDPSKAPNIQTKKTGAPSGTTVTVKVPKTFHNEETDTDEEIRFPKRYEASDLLQQSPLFENIAVKLNGSTVAIGANFPLDEYTVLSVAKFAWGKVRIMVAPVEYPTSSNVTFLSNGLMQFSGQIKKDPTDNWSGPAPFKFFFNIEPSVKADAPNYPIALNRKGLSPSAKGDFETLMKYLEVMYANTATEESAQSFGSLTLYSPDGKTKKQVDLAVPPAKAGTTLRIGKDDKVEIRDGRMYVNNRVMPEMTKDQLKAMKHDPTQFRVDQGLIDPDALIVHDNVLHDGEPYLEKARRELGAEAVDNYLLGFARAFQAIRDAAAKIGGTGYTTISQIPVGVSIDVEYHGVNTVIPFKAMMVNPTTNRGAAANVARAVVSTMIHEVSHHTERNHSETGFIPELQRMMMAMWESGDAAKAVAALDKVMKDYAHVYDYFAKEAGTSGLLKNRGIRLGDSQERVGGKGDADGAAGTSGGRGDAGVGTNLYHAVGAGDQDGTARQKRQGAPAAHAAGRVTASGSQLPRGMPKAKATQYLTHLLTHAKKFGLGGMITEDIADLAAYNGMTEVRDFVDVNKAREAERVEFEAPVFKVAELYNLLPEKERGVGPGSVNQFIQDATIRGNTEGIDRLSASGQALVKAVFKHGSDTLALKKKLIFEEVGREFDQRINESVSEDDKVALRKERARMLKRFTNLLTVKNSDTYAPLKRYGDYMVSAKSADYVTAEGNNDHKWITDNQSNPAHLQLHFVETQGEADALEDEIKRDPNFRGGKTYAAAREAEIDNHRDLFRAFPVLMTKLEAEYPAQGGISPMGRIMRDLYLQSLAEASARKSEMRRHGIAGADPNMMKAFVTQGRADSQFLASLKHNDKVQKAVQAMRDAADEDQRTRRPYLNEMLKRHAASYESHSASWANKIKRAGSLWMLSTNPTYYLQQLVQPWAMSLPVIAGKQGYFRTARALRQGYSDIAPLARDTKLTEHMDWSKAPADVRDMLKVLASSGAIDANTMEQGEWQMADKGKFGAAWNRVDGKLRGLNTYVEAINRSVTAIAAYRMELAQNGGNKALATIYAERMVRQTHGSYDGSNTPRFMQSPTAQVITQFRRFQIIQLSLIARLAHNAFRHSDPKEKALARRALTYTLLHSAALGGTLGMPGAALIAPLVARLFGPDDEPPDFEKWARENIGDQTISDLLLKGVPAMLGADLSSKLGMGQILSVAPFADFPHDRASMEKYAAALLGPTTGLSIKAMDGLNLIYQGQVAKGSEMLLPTGFSNTMKAYRLATEGVSMRSGDVIMSKDEIGFLDATMQALGMPTTTITHQRRLTDVKFEFDTYYKERTTELIRDFQQARKAGESTEDVRKEWNEMQEARVRNGYTRQPISTLLKSAQAQAKRERETVGGVEFSKANKRFVQSQANL